ncbi:MAG: hypothetical protein HGA70_02860 [Chlorobiaceae bacterium]|jgi:hypothetical protein|nr:hypothetical protein [Chlorobiaceae bacterium]
MKFPAKEPGRITLQEIADGAGVTTASLRSDLMVFVDNKSIDIRNLREMIQTMINR